MSRKAGYKICEISAYIVLNSPCWTQKEQWIQATQASSLCPHKIIMGIISRLLFSSCYNTAPDLRAPPTAKSHFNLNPRLHHPLINVPMSVSWVISILSSFLDTVTVYPWASSCCCVSLQIIQGTPVTQSILLSYKLLSPSSGRSAAPTSLYPACARTGLQGVLNVLEISFNPPRLVSYLAHFIFPFGAQLLLVASATHTALHPP